jgi:phytoene/squalene synthetase
MDRDSLLDYCRRSANPVGQLVLRLFGLDRSELDRLSDAICTALQLANFWQDLSRDLAVGRCYLPLGELQALGLEPEPASLRANPERLLPLLKDLSLWTAQLFDQGQPLVHEVPGRLAFELRLFLGGGRAILAEVDRLGVDILWQRPHLGGPRKLGIGLAALSASVFQGRKGAGWTSPLDTP